MSGHSKWATIKRQKGVADIKRGLTFTKIANAITIAVRQGGGVGDPAQNFRLRLAIEKARAVNMPKENIERAIGRAQGREASALEEVVYEGFGENGKVAFLIDAATDNKQRTTSEVKNLFDKAGAVLARPGAVSYQFETKGLIKVKKDGKSIDDIFLTAADGGAEDVEDGGDEALIYTKPEELTKVKDALSKSGLVVEEAELTRKPKVTIEITDQNTLDKIYAFIDRLESLDDIQKVYTNIIV